MHPTAEPARSSVALEVWSRDRLPQLTLVSRLAAEAGDQAEADLLTRAYVLVLAAEFQGFFADLLSDVAQALVDSLPAEVPPLFRGVLKNAMDSGRVVDFRNPDATTLRRDLARYGMEPRALVAGTGRDGRRLINRLDQVIEVRSKLAHGADSVAEVGADGNRLAPATVDEWSRDLDRLATILGNAVALHLDSYLPVDVVAEETS